MEQDQYTVGTLWGLGGSRELYDDRSQFISILWLIGVF